MLRFKLGQKSIKELPYNGWLVIQKEKREVISLIVNFLMLKASSIS